MTWRTSYSALYRRRGGIERGVGQAKAMHVYNDQALRGRLAGHGYKTR